MKKLLVFLVWASLLSGNGIAVVKSLDGTVIAIKDMTETQLSKGDILEEGMLIKTADKSGVTILFNDDSFTAVGANSSLSLDKYILDKNSGEYAFELFLSKGTASFESGMIGKIAPDKFKFKTPEGTVAIRGTKFFVKVK